MASADSMRRRLVGRGLCLLIAGLALAPLTPARAGDSYAQQQAVHAQGVFSKFATAIFWPPGGVVTVVAYEGVVQDQQTGLRVRPGVVLVACLDPPRTCSITHPRVKQFSMGSAPGPVSLSAQTAFGELTIHWSPASQLMEFYDSPYLFPEPAFTSDGHVWASETSEIHLQTVPGGTPMTGAWRGTYDGTFNGAPLLDPSGEPMAGRYASINGAGVEGIFTETWTQQA